MKLGFKPGFRVLVIAAPKKYETLLVGADGVVFDHERNGAGYDAAHQFLNDPTELPTAVPLLIPSLRPGGMIWLSWAKKTSKLHSGITEDMLRETVLPLGWVDVKVCAVNADWSGLKFLKRKG